MSRGQPVAQLTPRRNLEVRCSLPVTRSARSGAPCFKVQLASMPMAKHTWTQGTSLRHTASLCNPFMPPSPLRRQLPFFAHPTPLYLPLPTIAPAPPPPVQAKPPPSLLPPCSPRPEALPSLPPQHPPSSTSQPTANPTTPQHQPTCRPPTPPMGSQWPCCCAPGWPM